MAESTSAGVSGAAASGAGTGRAAEVVESVREMVAERLGVDRSELAPEADIVEDLGADSLDIVELVMALEERFEIEVPDEDLEGLRTLGQVENYVLSRVAR